MAPKPGLFSYLRPMALLRRRALTEGVFGPSTGWKVVALLIFGGKKLQDSIGKREQIVATEKMEPGETLILRTIPPLTRAERKAGVKR